MIKMSREICKYDMHFLCVNNYRGEDYNKPDTCVSCEECRDNPDNKHLKTHPDDQDKVIFEDKDFVEVAR